MLSVERDDEGDLKTTFGIEGQGSESVLYVGDNDKKCEIRHAGSVYCLLCKQEEEGRCH